MFKKTKPKRIEQDSDKPLQAVSISQKDYGKSFMITERDLKDGGNFYGTDLAKPNSDKTLKTLRGREMPIVIIDECLDIERISPHRVRIFRKSFFQRVCLGIYNFLTWIDRINQHPRIVDGILKCKKTPLWLGRLADYFYNKSK